MKEQNSKCDRWKTIPGFNGVYRISDSGMVRNCKTGNIIHPIDVHGTKVVCLKRNGSATTRSVTKLMRDIWGAGEKAVERPESQNAIEYWTKEVGNDSYVNDPGIYDISIQDKTEQKWGAMSKVVSFGSDDIVEFLAKKYGENYKTLEIGYISCARRFRPNEYRIYFGDEK